MDACFNGPHASPHIRGDRLAERRLTRSVASSRAWSLSWPPLQSPAHLRRPFFLFSARPVGWKSLQRFRHSSRHHLIRSPSASTPRSSFTRRGKDDDPSWPPDPEGGPCGPAMACGRVRPPLRALRPSPNPALPQSGDPPGPPPGDRPPHALARFPLSRRAGRIGRWCSRRCPARHSPSALSAPPLPLSPQGVDCVRRRVRGHDGGGRASDRIESNQTRREISGGRRRLSGWMRPLRSCTPSPFSSSTRTRRP